MRSKLGVGGFAAAVLLLAGSTVLAQTAAAPAAKPASKQTNIDQDIKLLPIYKSYEAELRKLNDLREANIREYAANYSNMTDLKADELVNQAISYYKKRADLIANYYDKIRAALGTGTAARFVQVESMLDNLIDLQIQSNMPLIWTPSSG
jgi:hypothetical protein